MHLEMIRQTMACVERDPIMDGQQGPGRAEPLVRG